MGPTVAVAFGVSLLLFKVFFRNDLRSAVSNLEQVMSEDENKFLKDKKILKKSCWFCLGLLLCLISWISPSRSLYYRTGRSSCLACNYELIPKRLCMKSTGLPNLLYRFVYHSRRSEHAGLIDVLSSVAIKAGEILLTFLMIIWLPR